MKITIMPPLRYANIRIPGGWAIGVPEISVDCETMVMVNEAGISEAGFARSMQTIFEKGQIFYVKEFVRYWSARYAKMFPDLHDEDGILGGFDPGDLIRFWLPGERAWGKDNVEIRAQLMEYADNERRRRDEPYGDFAS